MFNKGQATAKPLVLYFFFPRCVLASVVPPSLVHNSFSLFPSPEGEGLGVRFFSSKPVNSELRDEDHPETYIVEVVARVGVIAISRAAILSVVGPTATTNHAARACCSAGRVSLSCSWISAIPIGAPLPHIAVHIIQTPRVGCIRTHRLCSPRIG